MTDFNVGTKVKDRYRLIEFKGSGSFGEVWLAHDEVLDYDVAIKIYISLNPSGVDEFKSEYITTMGLSHPNLLTTTYFDVWEQHPFLVMKYCANGSTSKFASKLNEHEIWQFIHDVAAGLNYLHDLPEPIIHQDIKPDNILVDDNKRFLITDFGISKKIRSTMRRQSTRAIGAGAVAYMGPERFESSPSPVKASDIWSVGASIYELATGNLPFGGLGGGMLRSGADLPKLGDDWSSDLNMVMQSCLAKETWNRPTAVQLESYADAKLRDVPVEPIWVTMQCPPSCSDVNIDGGGMNFHPKRNWLKMLVTIMLFIAVSFGVWSVLRKQRLIEIEQTEAPTLIISQNPDTLAKNNTADNNDEAVPSGTGYETTARIETETKPTEMTSGNKQNLTIGGGGTVTADVRPTTGSEPTKTADNNASVLINALANRDYQTVQRLANEGYNAAYGHLAKYYLVNNEYSLAEEYGKKAKAAGYSEGDEVIKTLIELDYYN